MSDKKIIAFFADVHANLPAMKAVLTDIDNVRGMRFTSLKLN